MSHSLPPDISVESVKELLDAKEEFLLLDCRRPDEYEFVRLPAARLIPMDVIQERSSELEEFRNQRIIVYCHHGTRSEWVAQWLRAQGFPAVQNMSGGIDYWTVTIDTSLPRY